MNEQQNFSGQPQMGAVSQGQTQPQAGGFNTTGMQQPNHVSFDPADLLCMKNVIRLLALGLIIFYFVPTCFVSCTGMVIDVSPLKATTGFTQANAYLGNQHIDGNGLFALMIIIPIVIIGISFVRGYAGEKVVAFVSAVLSLADIGLYVALRNTIDDQTVTMWNQFLNEYDYNSYEDYMDMSQYQMISDVYGVYYVAIVLLILMIILLVISGIGIIPYGLSFMKLMPYYKEQKIKRQQRQVAIMQQNAMMQSYVYPSQPQGQGQMQANSQAAAQPQPMQLQANPRPAAQVTPTQPQPMQVQANPLPAAQVTPTQPQPTQVQANPLPATQVTPTQPQPTQVQAPTFKVCKNCGQQIPIGAEFCKYCGIALD